MEDKKGSVRIVRMNFNKSFIRMRNGNTKYYKSYIQQMEHDFRIEVMDATYLKRPNETNKYHKFASLDLDSLLNEWDKINKKHIKHKGKAIQKQTKETINILFSFSKNFDLPEEDREKQFKVVKKFVEERFDYPLYVVQHNDEKSLHYGATILNFDNQTNRPLSKQIDTSYLQDEFFDYLKKNNVDYGHRRGDPKEITNAENRGILEGKIIELEKQNEELKADMERMKELQADIYSALVDMVMEFYEIGMNYKGKSAEELLDLFKSYFVNESKFETLFDKVVKLGKKGGIFGDLSTYERINGLELKEKVKEFNKLNKKHKKGSNINL